MVTIKEIARQAGVSTTTVSNVLHKKNARVSAETIEKVERLLAENNYSPRLGLNALTNRSSRIICILITTPEFARGSAYETPFYGNMLGHLEQLLRERGYYIMIFSDKNVEEIEKMFAERLKGQDAEHNGGRKWVGTGGFTPFGHRGKKLGGIRVGGKSNYRSAYRVAGERKYREKNGRKNGRISKKE